MVCFVRKHKVRFNLTVLPSLADLTYLCKLVRFVDESLLIRFPLAAPQSLILLASLEELQPAALLVPPHIGLGR